eukprot:g23449.t1
MVAEEPAGRHTESSKEGYLSDTTSKQPALTVPATTGMHFRNTLFLSLTRSLAEQRPDLFSVLVCDLRFCPFRPPYSCLQRCPFFLADLVAVLIKHLQKKPFPKDSGPTIHPKI